MLTAGSEEPNALVTIGQGAQAEPNVRATVQELFAGLNAQSQNRWPSLRADLLAVNDLVAPFFSAGFYYKTFMWPRAFWERLYEPVIRRAAGLGALSGRHNADHYEKAFAFCDVLVIGGGPAGLMAALTAARAGADVILADEDQRFGGRLLAETEEVDGQPGAEWAASMVRELEGMDNVRLMPRTTVTGAYDQGTYGALERVGLHRPRDGASAAGMLLAHRRQAGDPVRRRAGTPDRLPQQRPARHHDGRRGARLSQPLGRGAGAARWRSLATTTTRTARRAIWPLPGSTVAAVIDSRAEAGSLGRLPDYSGAQVVATRGRQGLTGDHRPPFGRHGG